MKSSLALATAAGFCLAVSPSTTTVMAADETQIPGRPNDFTAQQGGMFQCDFAGSRCQVTGDFDRDEITATGGQITNVLEGPQWVSLNVDTDILTVGACTGDDCTVTCQFGCICTPPATGGAECPFTVVQAVTAAPTPAPGTVDGLEGVTPGPSPLDSGASALLKASSVGIMLVVATAVFAF